MEGTKANKVIERKGATSTKRTKFVELAERRTINAIRSIRVIGKLGNSFAYEYDERDVRKITAALNREIEDLRLRMAKKDAKASIDFRL